MGSTVLIMLLLKYIPLYFFLEFKKNKTLKQECSLFLKICMFECISIHSNGWLLCGGTELVLWFIHTGDEADCLSGSLCGEAG